MQPWPSGDTLQALEHSYLTSVSECNQETEKLQHHGELSAQSHFSLKKAILEVALGFQLACFLLVFMVDQSWDCLTQVY